MRNMSHLSLFSEKYLNRLVFCMLYLHIFLFTMHEIDTVEEVYLELFQRNMIETCCENS